MANLVQLTQTNGRQVIVNMDKVVIITERDTGGSTIDFESNRFDLHVIDDFDDLASLTIIARKLSQ